MAILAAGLAAPMTSGCESDCPDLEGDWTIALHCDEQFIGLTVTVEQDECGVSTTGPFSGFEGAVDDTGSFSIGGVVEGQVINCEGHASESQITMNCLGGCDVVFER